MCAGTVRPRIEYISCNSVDEQATFFVPVDFGFYYSQQFGFPQQSENLAFPGQYVLLFLNSSWNY